MVACTVFGACLLVSLKRLESSQKLTKPILATVRENGYTVAAYLDDFFQCELTCFICQQATLFLYDLLVTLGFIPNDDKSMYEPNTQVQSLGHVIDSQNMTVCLPESKSLKILESFRHLLRQPTVTIRYLSMVVGLMVSCFLVLPLG